MGTEIDYIVLTPAGTPDPSLAIAGSRAGALGILNLEFAADYGHALSALGMLEKFGRERSGVLLNGQDTQLIDLILSSAGPGVATIVLTPNASAELARLTSKIHSSGRQVLLIVHALEDALDAEAAGIDAVICKGNEAGGFVSSESSFVLFQQVIERCKLPVWVQGGIGLHTARACLVAGATGVVLDNQLLLAKESPLFPELRERLSAMDGSESASFGEGFGAPFRAYTRPDLLPARELGQLERDLSVADLTGSDLRDSWRDTICRRVDWRDHERSILAIGQDAAFANSLARKFVTVGGIIGGFRDSADTCLAQNTQSDPLAEGAPLAVAHGTRYPIVQGPMTRVSDRADFAAAVSESGALPMVALALMRAPEVRSLLEETQRQLGTRSWGVGILGFVPAELRAEQLEVIREFRPPLAIIAGGRPDQARTLEQDGTTTYLHVPSPGLLEMFLHDNARHFVFEGRECGGHVGPRSSFVLWESVVEVLLRHLRDGGPASDYHVLFAGGIHDSTSARMAAAIASPLVELGVRFGVVLGTAYLFTEEAVQSGAIVRGFQRAALNCANTVLLESGPGQATRCAPSPFVDDFQLEKRKLIQSELTPEELRNRLEDLNIGRLRIASKGIDRHPDHGRVPDAPRFLDIHEDDQWLQGMYMIGQVASLRDQVVTMAELHREISKSVTRDPEPVAVVSSDKPSTKPAEVAIVGMSSIVPGAGDLGTMWSNILNKVDSVGEVPQDRWDWRHYFDTDPATRDRVYSRWGGFIDDVPFDPISFGMPPNSLRSIEPFQLLTLVAVRDALKDAGYQERPFNRQSTSVILGAGGGAGDLSSGYLVRSSFAGLFGTAETDLLEELDGTLPEWTEDSFAGLLMNVAAGRVANRFDFGGVNYTVDAACASSLAAIYQAVHDLESYRSDVSIVGGIDALQSPFIFLCFSKTHALSPGGRCRPFDAEADGIAISEGFAVLVLKRLADAERDGDRIYGVIRGVGASSDGRDRGLTAPRPEGQVRALRRAYEHAGISPSTVGLIEAHGTGTVAGDRSEVESLTTFFNEHGVRKQTTAIGSIKSMIGHTKATAGVAGLVKATLALHHRVLPPTNGVATPNPKANFPDSPFYVNSETRPWIEGIEGHPRRAGVSAFGFGGTNFHVVLEEYTGNYLNEHEPLLSSWPAELFVWRDQSREKIQESISSLAVKLESGARPKLADLAWTLALQANQSVPDSHTLTIVADSIDDLAQKLSVSRELINDGAVRHHDPRGIHFSTDPLRRHGDVACLFPGQGSQYVNMARDLAIWFPQVRSTFEQGDRVLANRFDTPLSQHIFPPPAFDSDTERAQRAGLTATNVAQPALAVTEIAMFGLLRSFGLEPQMVAGHSFGEFSALWAAGCLSADDLVCVAEARGRFMNESSPEEAGTMAAIDADVPTLRPLISDLDVTFANMNAPEQTVISGATAVVEKAVERCLEHDIRARRLPVACAFHSPLVAPARQRLAEFLSDITIGTPTLNVFSNSTADSYPDDPESIVRILADHLVSPVEFVREILAMYENGARIFVEVGPRNVLTGLVTRILGDRPHLCVPLDFPGRPGLTSFVHAIAALLAEGVDLDLRRLFGGRNVERIDILKLNSTTGHVQFSPTTWLVNGGGVRPAIESSGSKKRPSLPLQITVNADKKSPNRKPDGVVAASSSISSPEEVGSPVEDRAFESEDSHAVVQSTVDVVPGASEKGSPMQISPEQTQSVRSHRSADDQTQVMQQFQGVMQHFLETQRSVMLAYLTGSAASMPGHAASANGQTANADPGVLVGYAHPVREIGAQSVPGTGPTNGHEPRSVSQPRAHEAQSYGAAAQYENGTEETGEVDKSEPDQQFSEIQDSGVWNRDRLTQHLLEIVSERTGYPQEMVGLDIDLEAELGIDSIKRVEIIGLIVRALDVDLETPPDMEQLTAGRTLRQLVDRLEVLVAPELPVEVDAAAGNGDLSEKEGSSSPFDVQSVETTIDRLGIQVVAAPSIDTSATLSSEGVIAIVDDNQGVGEALSKLVKRQGHQVHMVLPRGAQIEPNSSALTPVDLSNAEEVGRLAQRLREHYGQVKALVHLASLRDVPDDFDLDSESWQKYLAADLQALFLLTQALQPDLENAAIHGGSAVVAATHLGGSFAFEQLPRTLFSGHGGIAGYLKTLVTEWSNVRVKAVDFAASAPELIAERIFNEMMALDNLVEVGYRNEQRVILETVPSPLVPVEKEPPLDQSSVVLITGGARGITAEVAVKLAESFQSTLILVGRTELPDQPESPETTGLTDQTDLKKVLLRQLSESETTVTPSQVERAYRHLLAVREVRSNLERIERAGSRFAYISCDVSNSQAFGMLIDQLYDAYGNIDGVIHGAGIIEDKLIRDKKLSSFQRVIRTKTDSALTLARKLRPEDLRFLVFFSSVSGRYGNRGQADYAAASEILNKLAQSLDKRWPAHIVSINWGPWLTTGMVSPEVQRQFAERGVALIPPETGCEKLLEELRYGKKGDVEVVVGGFRPGYLPKQRLEPIREPARAQPAVMPPVPFSTDNLPLLSNRGFESLETPGGVEIRISLNTGDDQYLLDHQIDGRCVFPFAVATELMAEVAMLLEPQHQVVEVRNQRLLSGIVLDDQPAPIKVVATRQGSATAGVEDAGAGQLLDVAIFSIENQARCHYKATLVLGERVVATVDESARQAPLEDSEGASMDIADAYHTWLFHGPRFQQIDSVEAMGPAGAQATLHRSTPMTFLGADAKSQWAIDPVLLDCALQLQLLWARQHWDVTSLPNEIGRCRIFASATYTADLATTGTGNHAAPELIRCELRIRPRSINPSSIADYRFFDSQGRTLGTLDGVQMVGSKALNSTARGTGK